jgi:hypothetical protein
MFVTPAAFVLSELHEFVLTIPGLRPGAIFWRRCAAFQLAASAVPELMGILKDGFCCGF